MAAMIAVRRQ
jgi:peptidyl-prolyl cis-trans isomerase B (cyclophilin B)